MNTRWAEEDARTVGQESEDLQRGLTPAQLREIGVSLAEDAAAIAGDAGREEDVEDMAALLATAAKQARWALGLREMADDMEARVKAECLAKDSKGAKEVNR